MHAPRFPESRSRSAPGATRCGRRRSVPWRATCFAAPRRLPTATDRGRNAYTTWRDTTSFDEPTGGFPPGRRARVDAREAVGEILKVKQPAVAKLERRADIYVSEPRAYIEARGGRLDIVAEFPQGSAVIADFSQAGEDGESR